MRLAGIMVLRFDQDHKHDNGYVPADNSGSTAGKGVLEQAITQEVSGAGRQVNYPRLLELGRELLVALGEDPDREGLQGTPRRWADWWREFIEYDPGNTETTFSSVSTDQLVCVSGMRVFSLCEHHLLPMWCDVSIGYVPGDKVLGLSKFARIA